MYFLKLWLVNPQRFQWPDSIAGSQTLKEFQSGYLFVWQAPYEGYLQISNDAVGLVQKINARNFGTSIYHDDSEQIDFTIISYSGNSIEILIGNNWIIFLKEDIDNKRWVGSWIMKVYESNQVEGPLPAFAILLQPIEKAQLFAPLPESL